MTDNNNQMPQPTDGTQTVPTQDTSAFSGDAAQPQDAPTQVFSQPDQATQNPYAQQPQGYTQPVYIADQQAAQGGQGAQQNPYAQPAGNPYAQYAGQPPYQPYYVQPSKTDSWNALCIVGFILAFIIPPAGLIVSIIALVEINKSGEKSKGMSIAGIIVSACITALMVAAVVFGIHVIGKLVDDYGHDYYDIEYGRINNLGPQLRDDLGLDDGSNSDSNNDSNNDSKNDSDNTKKNDSNSDSKSGTSSDALYELLQQYVNTGEIA